MGIKMHNQKIKFEDTRCKNEDSRGIYLNEAKLQWLIQQSQFPKDIYDKLQAIIKDSIVNGITNDDEPEIAEDWQIEDWQKL